MVRREGRRPDSTLNGMNSLEGGCSVESGFMGVQWKGSLVRTMERSYQYWKNMIKIGPENTCKWLGKNRDGRIPLPMAKTALRGEAYSMSWEHTQMVRREGRRPNSTLNGMNSLEGGCSVESGFMGVQWKGSLVRPMERSYQYWKNMIKIGKGVHWRIMAEHDKRRHMI
ncbi:hypothetical protein F2Q69_00058349 [Brassica cretica]|uniref:Uncharacterized protein n=1 Tax=Brassica cretica TaxID=69181 RepID=A0A8S9RK16_BRACR|nr:hypothetical protein F2Q69_00058349 [Brassica cretica]